MSDQTAPLEAPTRRHPLIHAGKWLLADLLSTLTFLALFAVTRSLYLAVAIAIALGLGQIAYLKFRQHPIDVMQWLSLCLVVVFGGATLLTHNPVFFMLKPSLIYCAIAAVMLRPGWMNRYVTGPAHEYGADITTLFGYGWAALMFVTAAANLALALYASPAAWASFLGVFPILSKFVLVGVQYDVTRVIVRRRILAWRVLEVSDP